MTSRFFSIELYVMSFSILINAFALLFILSDYDLFSSILVFT